MLDVGLGSMNHGGGGIHTFGFFANSGKKVPERIAMSAGLIEAAHMRIRTSPTLHLGFGWSVRKCNTLGGPHLSN